MAKRFHDTEIWGEDWFLALSDNYMMLWFWVKDKCDHAGIWKPNKTSFEKTTGKTIDLKKALELFNDDKERIMVLSNGRWLIPDFIPFQYGHTLNPKNRVHLSILEVLKKNEVKLTSIRGLIEVRQGVKDKDKDKDKDNNSKKPLSDEEFLKKLESNPAYKEIDIKRELDKMDAWLSTRPGRKKTRRFIVNWLNKIDKPLKSKPYKEPHWTDDPKTKKDFIEGKQKIQGLTNKIGKEIK